MKKMFIMVILLSVVAQGADLSEQISSTYRFQPCDSWNLGTPGNWQCSFLGRWIEVVTIDEVNRLEKTIEAQDQKIAQLEERLQRLER